jgi:hypothetical protein
MTFVASIISAWQAASWFTCSRELDNEALGFTEK